MQAAQETFISSSYWTEAIGPVAALATLKKMKKVNLPKHFKKIAAGVAGAWRASAKKYEMPIEVSENLAILTFSLTGSRFTRSKNALCTRNAPARIFGIKHFLRNARAQRRACKKYAKAVDEVFGVIARARKEGGIKKYLKGPVAHSGFQRLN
jgi:glutamate-1-semialdehyde 2,1-aminomutase